MLQQLQEWDEKARCTTDTNDNGIGLKDKLMLDSAWHWSSSADSPQVQESKGIQLPSIDPNFDVFGVENILDIGEGEPLFGNFEYEAGRHMQEQRMK